VERGLVNEGSAQAGAEIAGRGPRTGKAGSQEQVRSRTGNTTGAVKGRGRRGDEGRSTVREGKPEGG
jgi:hypothetical protein